MNNYFLDAASYIKFIESIKCLEQTTKKFSRLIYRVKRIYLILPSHQTFITIHCTQGVHRENLKKQKTSKQHKRKIIFIVPNKNTHYINKIFIFYIDI